MATTPVSVNIGGKVYTTSAKTLTRYPSSVLGSDDIVQMYEAGTLVFFDRDPDLFAHILDFLRTEAPFSEYVPPPDTYTCLRLIKEAKWYKLVEMVSLLEAYHKEQEKQKAAIAASGLARPQDMQMPGQPAAAMLAPNLALMQMSGASESSALGGPAPGSMATTAVAPGHAVADAQSQQQQQPQQRYSKYVVLVFERVVVVANDKPVAGYYIINGKQSSIETEGWFSSFELESLQNTFRVAVSRLLERHVELGYVVANTSTNVCTVRGTPNQKRAVDYHLVYTVTVLMEKMD